MSTIPHIADAADEFFVLAVTPDMCRVGKEIVAFKPMQTLSPEEGRYSQRTYSRDQKILLVQSIIKGVTGNAGSGLKSGVSAGSGNVEVTEGCSNVEIEGRRVARDGDEVDMNVAM